MVEFALVFPILILLILGIIEFAILILDYNTVSNAAREGARYGIVHPPVANIPDEPCPDPLPAAPGNLVEAACRLTTGLDPAGVRVKVTLTGGGSGSLGRITVRVRYDAHLITAPVIRALGGAGQILLAGEATMEREQ